MPKARKSPPPTNLARAPRRRAAHNLYIDSVLVERAKKIAPSTPHKSLSGLVEYLLASHIEKVRVGETPPAH